MALDLTSNKYMAITRPNGIRDALVVFASVFGFRINQQKTWADFTTAFSAVAVGAQTLQMIPAGFQYSDSEHFVITAYRMYQGTNAVVLSTSWTPGVTDGIANNGTITINNNGTNVSKDLPLTVFSSGTNNADGGYYELSKPVVWVGQTVMQALITFPIPVATATLNLRLEFFGLKLI